MAQLVPSLAMKLRTALTIKVIGKILLFLLNCTIRTLLVGRQTDKDGRVNAWWTDETASRYLERARCFIEQYGNYTFPEFYGTKAYRV